MIRRFKNRINKEIRPYNNSILLVIKRNIILFNIKNLRGLAP